MISLQTVPIRIQQRTPQQTNYFGFLLHQTTYLRLVSAQWQAIHPRKQMHLQPQYPACKAWGRKIFPCLMVLLYIFAAAMAQLWFLQDMVLILVNDNTSQLNEKDEAQVEPNRTVLSDNNLNNKSLPWAIFYNIFIPTDQGPAGIANAKRIVEEQVDFIRRSSAIPQNGNGTVTIFYNTIGEPGVVNQSTMQRICSGSFESQTPGSPRAVIQCHHMKHYKKAFEEVTLQRMHAFCLSHNDMRVSYIHTKGSYHEYEDRRNEYWRHHGTLAAVDEQCVDPPEKSCNVCGLQFWTQWVPFMPGNFFTASCSYVKELVPPVEFRARMEEIKKEVLLMTSQGIFQHHLFTDRNDHLGVGRFAAEHWIGSHPRLNPCDLSTHGNFRYWIRGDHGSKEFSFAMAPRHEGSIFPTAHYRSALQRLKMNRTLRVEEFFFLAGRLFKYFKLYGEYPPDESWVLSFLPDGEDWKSAVRRQGQRAVEIVIREELDRVKNLDSGAMG